MMSDGLVTTEVERRQKRICRQDESNATLILGVNNNTTNINGGKVGHAFQTPPSLQAKGNLLQLNGGPGRTSCYPTSSNAERGASTSTGGTTNMYAVVDESNAKRQIQLICRTPACWRGESDSTLMLYLLQRFPVLASQVYDWDYNLFWKHGNEWSSPLSFLLVAGAKLEIIQAVYNLYPAALWQPSGIHRDLPLHFACRFGVSEDVLMFLLAKFPVAVTVSNLSGMLPIHCAMGKKEVFPYGKFKHARLETIRLLLEIYPQSLLKEENEKQFTPLQLAFNHGYSFQVVDYMISKLPDQVEEFKLIAGCYHKLFGVKVDLTESELICKLLPKLRRFQCQPTRWETEGLVRLLVALQQNKSINEFQASNISSDVLQDGTVSSALSTLLDQNIALETISLEMQERDQEEGQTDTFIRSLGRVFQNNQSLKMLELSNFSATIGTLTGLLASENAPEVVRLNNFLLLQDGNDNMYSCRSPHRNSKLRKLVISGCRVLSGADNSGSLLVPSFLSLLHCIARLPRLTELTLRLPYFKELDITVPLVYLLQNGSLETLAVRGPMIRMEPFCATLRINTTLLHLDYPKCLIKKCNRDLLAKVLENHNATLQTVRIGNLSAVETEKECTKILHYTQLNQFGRATVRNPNATKALVVNLLQDVSSFSPNFQHHETLDIHYGLLRESPSLWV